MIADDRDCHDSLTWPTMPARSWFVRGWSPSSALDDARARVAEIGGTIGEQLVAAASITDDALTEFYRPRLLVPQVNPNTLARLPAKVVATIPSDMAIELRAIPVSLDADNNLTVAMSDPSDRHAVDEIAFFTGAYVVRAVATQMQIAWCLAHYYGHVTRSASGCSSPSRQVERPELDCRSRDRREPVRGRCRREAGAAHARRSPARSRRCATARLVPGEATVESPSASAEVEAPPASARATDRSTASRPLGVGRDPRPRRRAPSIRPPMPRGLGPGDHDGGGRRRAVRRSRSRPARSDPARRRARAKTRTPVKPCPHAAPPPGRARSAGARGARRRGRSPERGRSSDRIGGRRIMIDELLDEDSVPEHVEPSRASAIESAGLRDVSGEIAIVRERQARTSASRSRRGQRAAS